MKKAKKHSSQRERLAKITPEKREEYDINLLSYLYPGVDRDELRRLYKNGELPESHENN